MCLLKLCFSGSLGNLRARYGSRLRRLAPFHIREVNRLALGESTLSIPRKPDLTFQQLDPRRALQVLHWPIRVIRVVTDPVVDSIFLVMSLPLAVPPELLSRGYPGPSQPRSMCRHSSIAQYYPSSNYSSLLVHRTPRIQSWKPSPCTGATCLTRFLCPAPHNPRRWT